MKIQELKQQIIEDERLYPLEGLPLGWKEIYKDNNEEYKMRLKEEYIIMARLFFYKLSEGDIDLFNKRKEFYAEKKDFLNVFKTLAYESLEFYSKDFKISNYINFEECYKYIYNIFKEQEKEQEKDPDQDPEQELNEKIKIIKIAEDLFKYFGYDMPASFYKVHLAPIYRKSVCEIVPLRFSEEDKRNARSWDAILHGQKVFPIQLKVQSISSKYGFFWEHGCGCNHGLSRLTTTESPFDYDLRDQMKDTWIKDYIWTCWYEYAFFNFTPVTKFLTGNILTFE